MHPSELHALTEKKLEIQRQKRIRVGREEGRVIDGLNLDDEKLLNDDHHVAAYCHTEQEIIINEDAVNNKGIEIISVEDTNMSIITSDYNSEGIKVYNIQTTQNVTEQMQTTLIHNKTILSKQIVNVNYDS